VSAVDLQGAAADASAAAAVDEAPERLLRRLWRSRNGRAGMIIVGLVFLLAFVGPLFAPYDETDVVGRSFEPPSGAFPLGTDFLGHDLLSRLLAGGNTVVLLSIGATLLPYLICVPIGTLIGYRGGRLAGATMRGVDVLLAFPALIFVLMLLSGLGTELWVIVLGITIITMPRVVRIVRAVSEELSVRGFVEAAELRGDSSLRIVLREILPNIWTPVLADLGVRFAGTAALVASLSFLGFGLQPPGADWGVMIYENRSGLTLAPLGVFAPAACIGAFMVGANLLGDAVAQLAGRVVDARDRYT
jgi:ABC-type dipeptide/oligopeptide/nickel transport system permease subunit